MKKKAVIKTIQDVGKIIGIGAGGIILLIIALIVALIGTMAYMYIPFFLADLFGFGEKMSVTDDVTMFALWAILPFVVSKLSRIIISIYKKIIMNYL